MDDLNLSDSDPDALFDSPATKQRKHAAKATQAQHSGRTAESRYDAEESREAALRAELDGVRNVNATIESLVASLTAARDNMRTVDQTVRHSATLLHTWTRILSATEHNQRLILNPGWQGASQDLADAENEERLRAAAAERRAREEQERKQELARKAEEEERRRAVAASGKGRTGGVGRGTRGRTVGGASRTTPGATSSGYVGVGGQGGRGAARGSASSRASSSGSGIGRGARGRGRG